MLQNIKCSVICDITFITQPIIKKINFGYRGYIFFKMSENNTRYLSCMVSMNCSLNLAHDFILLKRSCLDIQQTLNMYFYKPCKTDTIVLSHYAGCTQLSQIGEIGTYFPWFAKYTQIHIVFCCHIFLFNVLIIVIYFLYILC